MDHETPRLRIGNDIAERLMHFSVSVLAAVSRLRRGVAGRHVAAQLIRSATAAGALYEEARAAESRADFVHKLGIAAKEAREAVYWANLVQQSGWLDMQQIVTEARHLAAILGASARTARANAERER